MIIRDYTDADLEAVLAIDTRYETASIYDLVVTPARLELVERRLEVPRTKSYPIEDVFAHWAQWDRGWVADDGGVIGFAGVAYEAWHRRLVLWHLYVQPARRRGGIGRALLDRVEAYGRERGARRVWLETSSVNPPGIAAYQRLGYALCGGDTTEYDALPYADEAALYYSKRL